MMHMLGTLATIVFVICLVRWIGTWTLKQFFWRIGVPGLVIMFLIGAKAWEMREPVSRPPSLAALQGPPWIDQDQSVAQEAVDGPPAPANEPGVIWGPPTAAQEADPFAQDYHKFYKGVGPSPF